MTRRVDGPAPAVKIDLRPQGLAPRGRGDDAPLSTRPVIAALVVTWNRKNDADKVIAALSRQEYPLDNLHVVIIDNSSTDGTQDFLTRRWLPERIVENPTDRAHEPRFESPLRVFLAEDTGLPPPSASLNGRHDAPRPALNGQASRARNAGNFASCTIVRNHANLGGCGGFNTGLAYARHAFATDAAGPLDFVWLVDDDTDLPADALARLVSAASSDPRIGLVGSRTVDIVDRTKTIETTIYFDRARGVMQDHTSGDHPGDASHRGWLEQVGSTRGVGSYTGLRDVDIVSACSMLARWSAVEKVGFWDWRYFIYCDDADWCLRFGKAGYRVVLNLDAVVYHTPWNMKLTVARIYYAHRNVLWMLQKVVPNPQLRRIMTRRMASILRDSLSAAFNRRLFHADVIRRTALDAARNRAGKLRNEGPMPQPVLDVLRQAGVLRPGATIAALCGSAEALLAADTIRRQVQTHAQDGPRWVYCTRNTVPEGPAQSGLPPPARIIYGGRWQSRLRRQPTLWRYRPDAVIVFDQVNDFPALAGKWNIHVDTRWPTQAQLERDGPLRRARFICVWLATAVRCTFFARTVKPYTSPTIYG